MSAGGRILTVDDLTLQTLTGLVDEWRMSAARLDPDNLDEHDSAAEELEQTLSEVYQECADRLAAALEPLAPDARVAGESRVEYVDTGEYRGGRRGRRTGRARGGAPGGA